MNVSQALAAAASLRLDRLDAQLLLLHALGRDPHDRAWLIAHDDAPLGDAEPAFLRDCRRRADGEPLAYLVGRKEFHGLALSVDARVLVPRPDTETLVDWATELLSNFETPRVIDLGTGSGAIALAVAKACPRAVVEAVDASAPALEVARSNAAALGLHVRVREADWLQGADTYELILSNPPYIATGDPHLPDLVHEPLSALVSGPDGLDDLRRIVDAAPRHLVAGGWLLLEHGHDQAGAVRALLSARGFAAVQGRRDLAGIERCSGGQWLEKG